ncbi:MAG: efflux RND transporter permease subunit [Hyphomicrobiales bacterium]|nr:efflux RND transporter permease subunit [Hyphomicrobiales bacterium]
MESETLDAKELEPKGPLLDTASLGLAGRMARAFIHSPLSFLLLLCSLAIGILGLVFTPRQEDPQISVPMVDVFFQYPGAAPEQVASLAIDPLERMMSEIPGVKHVYSAAQRGRGMVTVQFEVGEEMEPSLVKLYDKLMSNMDKIPPGVSEPLVKPKGVDDVPVVTLTLWSHDLDDATLRIVALDVLQRLKEVQDTSQSFIVGGRLEEMRIEPSPQQLSSYGISIGQLAQTIRHANSERQAGYGESSDNSFKLYTGSFLHQASDVERLVVGVHNGRPVYLRDVAQVSEGPGEYQNYVFYFTGPAYQGDAQAPHGASAVTIAVAKKPGTNGVTVADDVLRQVEHLKGRIIPDNIQVSVTRNYGETANDKVNELIFKLFVATGAVTLLVWFFLGLQAALVVLIVIPVVILVTVFSAWLLGYTIDRVSLFALIFSIGILVDDAIVVVENIYRRWLMKGGVDDATSIDAVREVGNPTILATFTVIAALLPMGFVSGMMGPYMEPIPVLGSVAMLFSLFAAFIFTPWLAMRIRPSLEKLKKAEDREHKQSMRLERFYRRLLGPMIESPAKARLFRITLYMIMLACFVLFYTTDVTVKMLPLDNKPEFNVVVNMPEGTALPVTANVTQQLAAELLKIEEVTAIQTYSGTASPFNFNGLVRHYYLRQDSWLGDIQVQLLPKGEREASSHELAERARAMLTPLAQQLGGRIQVVEMPPGPPVLQTVVAEVYGPDARTRRQVAYDLTQIFERAEGVVDVDNYLQEPYEVWRFVVDREKAVRRGVSVEDINSQLEMVMGGFKLGDVKTGRVLEPRYLVLQMPLALRSQLNSLGELPVQSAEGQLIPLSELGRFERHYEDPWIFHKDLRAVEYVTGEVSGRLAAPIYGMFAIEDLLKDYVAPDGVKVEGFYIGPPEDSFQSAFEWTGEWTVTYETFRDMGIAFAAALVLIYMLVVWEFGNFRLPAIIMAPIPMTLIGIIPGHWLMGAEFTATSMIGFIALAGIIVRNSILLVDFSARAVEHGMSVGEAVIQSCRTRTRPILITAFALVMGSSVILTDPIFQGMAISLMFGVMVSTLLTLAVIPLGCVKAAYCFMEHAPKDAAAQAHAADTHVTGKRDQGAAGTRDDSKDEGGGLLAKLAMVFYGLRAVLYFAWVGIKSFFGWLGRLLHLEKLAMVFYALRAVPYFIALFVRETFKRKPKPAPKPAAKPAAKPAPAAKADPAPAAPAAATPAEAKVAPAPQSEPAKPEPAKTEPPKAEPPKAEPEPAPDREAPAAEAPARKPAAKKAPVAKTTVAKTTVAKTPAKKSPAKKSPARKAPAKAAAVRKGAKAAPAAKPAAEAAPTKAPAAKKTATKKAPAKGTSTAKGSARKAAAAKPSGARGAKRPPRRGIQLRPRPGGGRKD